MQWFFKKIVKIQNQQTIIFDKKLIKMKISKPDFCIEKASFSGEFQVFYKILVFAYLKIIALYKKETRTLQKRLKYCILKEQFLSGHVTTA